VGDKMKKYFLVIILAFAIIFAASMAQSASAALVDGKWNANNQKAITIWNSQSADFEYRVQAVSYYNCITGRYSIKLYRVGDNAPIRTYFNNQPSVNNGAIGNITIYSSDYNTPGDYTVVISAIDYFGTDTEVLNLKVNPVSPISLTCNANPTNGYAPLTTTFTAFASGGLGVYNNYKFVFGDGTTQNIPQNSVQHIYTAPGSYQTIITVTDTLGNSASKTCPTITVTEFIPELMCDATPTTGGVPLNVQFEAVTPYMSPSAEFETYELDFGDGQIYYGNDYLLAHTYDSLGNFYPVLKGTTSRGITVTANCPTITVDLGDYTIFAKANGPYTGYITEPVMLTAQGSYTSYGEITNYVWNFGDGTTFETTEPILYHTYNSIGVFDVKLTVYDKYGLSATDYAKATIIEPYTPKPVEENIESGLWIGRILINGKDGVQEVIRPNDDLKISLDLKNYYEYRINDARITIEITELGIKQKSSSFDLSRGQSRTQNIVIPMYDVPTGHYYLKIIVQDNDVRRIKYRDLFVQNDVKNSIGCYINSCGGY
jgi:PKD repeat protein